MSEYEYGWDGGRDRSDRQRAIEERALALMELGCDWLTAVAEATREVTGHATRRGPSRPQGAPGKLARTARLPAGNFRVVVDDIEQRKTPANGVAGAAGTIQARSALEELAADSEAERERLRREAARALGGTAGPLPYLETIQRLFGHHDVSAIHAHVDSNADEGARAMGAEAFTMGARVAFSGTPSLFTAAHEAAHVIQQRAGVAVTDGIGREGDRYEEHADRVAERVVRGQSAEDLLDAFVGPAVATGLPGATASSVPSAPVQMRRLPPNVAALLTAISGTGNGANFDAHADGVERLIERALADLTPAQRTLVMTNRRAAGSLTQAQFNALPRRERLIRTVDAIRALFPHLQHGDPTLIDAPPTTALQRANLSIVVANANSIFLAIAAGTQDTSIGQVFGTGNIAAAKRKYSEAQTWMNRLYVADKIVTDRSGYNEEAGLGGLTGFQTQISVQHTVIDRPTDNDSIITLIHESMHAGNADVDDNGYLGAPQFDTRSEADKLNNAAHYEVIPWRIRAPTHPFAYPVVPHTTPPTFRTFVPAGTTVGGVTAPAPTIPQRALRAASEILRSAWTIGLNLHMAYVKLFRTPTEWTVPQPEFGGMRFDNSLKFWSKVGKLTIHRKGTINPSSANPAVHPVSQVDVALSEGLIRKLSAAMQMLDPIETDAQVRAFEAAHSSPAELAREFPGGAHTNVNRERNFVLRLVLRDPSIRPITGSAARDLRVVKKMGDPALVNWTDILAPRNPSSFAD